ncbi:hypothetical protein D3C71_1864380 [compost metagenome]
MQSRLQRALRHRRDGLGNHVDQFRHHEAVLIWKDLQNVTHVGGDESGLITDLQFAIHLDHGAAGPDLHLRTVLNDGEDVPDVLQDVLDTTLSVVHHIYNLVVVKK